MQKPNILLQGCKKFHNMESRDIAYVVASYLLKKCPRGGNCNILAGVKMLLLTWNNVYIQREPEEVKRKMDKEILQGYRKINDILSKLKKEKLESIDLENPKIIQMIKTAFKKLSAKKSIGPTGASKILHLLNPNLFIMWDLKIKKAYHKLHRYQKKKHKEGSEECYIELMRNLQQIAKNLVTKISAKELWEKHPKAHLNFVNFFRAKESIPKMLDECNYVRFTKADCWYV